METTERTGLRGKFPLRLARIKCMAMGVAALLGCPIIASAQTYSRTEVIEYHDNTTLWVMGQVKKTTCVASVPADPACDGQTDSVMSETNYHGTWAVPTVSKQFGKVVKTLGYDTTSSVASGQRGTVKTIKDGNNNVTTATNWKRGIPQSIAFADGNTQSAMVNNHGWITSVDDELNSRTCYAYDTMGRITEIKYTSESAAETCNTSTWAATTASFTKSASAKYGLPVGHWQQAVSTGNGRKIVYFDALWRPVVEEAFDNANAAATRSVTVKHYDTSNRLIFQSYPMASLGSYADAGLKGTHTDHDALDRAWRVRQDWEGVDQLTTTTEYLTGFKTRVTPPRGQGEGATYQTVTEYMAYDQPTTDWPVKITHPASAYTHVIRDVFGKPTKLRRSNSASLTTGTIALDRTYAYNDHQELCRSVEPETGATLMGYDGAGNLTWSASGLPAGTACHATGNTTTINARKAARTYDSRNRIETLSFPGGLGNTTHAYTPDGLLASIVADNGDIDVTTSYTYNRRRLPIAERMLWGAIDWTIQYGYSGNGHLASQSYPGNAPLTVDYAPNALGQPTQAGSFATGVSYFPNGGIKQFTYGNDVVHTLTQNARGLPDTSCDYHGTCNASAAINDGYDYDQHGNVAAISDGRTGNRGDRAMTYDALDRLTQAISPMFGTANYGYDVLDNLTHVQVGATPNLAARDHHYCYDAAWRLANVKTGSCAGSSVIGLGYDVQGNLSNKNGRTYTFDYGNRLRSVSATLDDPETTFFYDGHGRRVRDYPGMSTYSFYTQSGQLAFVNSHRAANQVQYIYLGGSLVAQRVRTNSGGTVAVRYQHTDALGSPVAMTDANRNVIERTEHEPYGRVGNRALRDGPGYTGHVEDAATGLNYMQQRYYDPQLGVFLSVDPVTAYQTPVANFNRYRYASSNPFKYIDPDGRVVHLAGKTEDQKLFIQKAQELTGLTITQNKDGTLSAAGDVNNGAAEALSGAINSDQKIGIQIVRNDPNVHVDQYETGQVDVGDISKFANASQQLGQATLAHVFVEHRMGVEMGGRTRENWLMGPHQAGLAAEYSIMGATHRLDNGRSFLRKLKFFDLNYDVTYERNGRVIHNFSFDMDSD